MIESGEISISASEAKQTFGQLLAASNKAPVRITKHGRVVAMLARPDCFAPTDPLAERRAALLQQAMVEKDRLIRHQAIALKLLTANKAQRQALIDQARAVVRQWQAERLCSADYIERWQTMLALPVAELATTMVGDAEGWGPALRQNSPWVGVKL